MLAKLFGHVSDRDNLLRAKHHPAAATAAVITINAVASFRHVVHAIQWSYDDTPAAGAYLRIAVNGTTETELAITAGGPGGYSFPVVGGVNQAIVVTLASPGGSATGKVHCQYTTESDRSK